MKKLYNNRTLAIVIFTILNVALVGGAFASGHAVGFSNGADAQQKENGVMLLRFLKKIEQEYDIPNRRQVAETVLMPVLQSEAAHDLSTLGSVLSVESLNGGRTEVNVLLKSGDERTFFVSKKTKLKGAGPDGIQAGDLIVAIGSPGKNGLEADFVQVSRK